MVDMPEVETDEQDLAEVFDEDNTNLDADGVYGLDDPEQAEDKPDVYDVTTAIGDDDDDAAVIGEDLDDNEIVASADEDLDGDLEDDELVRGSEQQLDPEDLLDDPADVDDEDFDDEDGVDKLEKGEVELEYAGDLTNLEGAQSSAADMESDTLSDDDLRELDYKDA